MPRRVGWFLVIERLNEDFGSRASAAQPVDSQRDVCTALRRLAPIIPPDSQVYLEWR